MDMPCEPKNTVAVLSRVMVLARWPHFRQLRFGETVWKKRFLNICWDFESRVFFLFI